MTARKGFRLTARVTPRAKRTSLTLVGDVLKIAISAPPVDGKANAAVIKLLAKRLGLKKSAVTIVVGQSGRDKVIELVGIDRATFEQRLETSA